MKIDPPHRGGQGNSMELRISTSLIAFGHFIDCVCVALACPSILCFTSFTSFTLLNLVQLAHSLASKIFEVCSGQRVFDFLHEKQSGNQTNSWDSTCSYDMAPSDPAQKARARIMACWSWNVTGDGAAEGFEISKIWQIISFYQIK